MLQTKLLAFALSSFIIGVAGVLWAFAYLGTVEPHGFDLDRSFQMLFIIIIGGLASIRGAFFGAALHRAASRSSCHGSAVRFFAGVIDSGRPGDDQRIVLGALIILFLIVEPEGSGRSLGAGCEARPSQRSCRT